MKPFKTLIAPVVIAAMAVTGLSAAKARADNNDLAKLIIGAVAVAAIADALDHNDKKAVATSSAQTRYTTGSGYAGRVVEDSRYRDDRHREARMARALTPQCLKSYRSRHGARELYDGYCLKHTNKRLSDLPRRCEVRVVVRGGKNRVAYEPRCLTRAGFWEGDGRHWDRNGGRYDSHDSYYDKVRREERAREEQQRSGDRSSGHIVYGN